MITCEKRFEHARSLDPGQVDGFFDEELVVYHDVLCVCALVDVQ